MKAHDGDELQIRFFTEILLDFREERLVYFYIYAKLTDYFFVAIGTHPFNDKFKQ